MKPTIRTFAELHHAMKQFYVKHVAHPKYAPRPNEPKLPTVKDVLWLVALHQASGVIENYSTKDMASMLLDGVKPITKKSVETEWLALNLEAMEDGEEPWDFDQMFVDFYGVKK